MSRPQEFREEVVPPRQPETGAPTPETANFRGAVDGESRIDQIPPATYGEMREYLEGVQMVNDTDKSIDSTVRAGRAETLKTMRHYLGQRREFATFSQN